MFIVFCLLNTNPLFKFSHHVTISRKMASKSQNDEFKDFRDIVHNQIMELRFFSKFHQRHAKVQTCRFQVPLFVT